MEHDESRIREAARLLAAGEVVAFPTETVYGLGADAASPRAVARIYELKGRPSDHPVIVHLAPDAPIEAWALEIPPVARRLAARFWPGPLTLILRKAARVPAIVTGGQDTVAIRVPSHPVARALLAEFSRVGSGGIAAPSANRFGRVSPTTAAHVRDEFGDAVPVLDGGACDVGLESTIVDVSRGEPVLLRPGGVPRVELAAAIGGPLKDRDASAPRASGTLVAHYAPRTPLALVDAASLERELLASPGSAVLALRAPARGMAAWIDAGDDPERYGHDLYANLRALDAMGAARILVEQPPRHPAWEAVNDRLSRAAAGAPEDDEP